MFGIGGSEFIIIAIIALIFLGPDKLPEATKKISRGIRELKKGSRTLQATIENDEHIGGAIRDLKSALRGEEPAPRPVRKRKKVKRKIASPEADVATEKGAAKAEPIEAAPALEASSRPAVKLPASAGEPDAEARESSGDAEELAGLVRPAAGTIAKGAAEEALPSEQTVEAPKAS
jgi:sec-independent protein translocase protein TatB